MGAKKGNRNALKYGLYAKYITPETSAGLKEMPTDEFYMELNILRVIADNGLYVYSKATSEELQHKCLSLVSVTANRVINAICKLNFHSGKAPQLKPLWDAIDENNRQQKVGSNI